MEVLYLAGCELCGRFVMDPVLVPVAMSEGAHLVLLSWYLSPLCSGKYSLKVASLSCKTSTSQTDRVVQVGGVRALRRVPCRA
jgi:hypothetical protein